MTMEWALCGHQKTQKHGKISKGSKRGYVAKNEGDGTVGKVRL